MARSDGKLTIGFIGLGTIGAVVARNLQQAGYSLIVHDLRGEAMAALINKATRSAGTAAELARECSVVFSSLPGPREVEAVALGADGLLHGVQEGCIYVDLSSSSPELIQKISGEFAPRGARVMDAPLIVGKNGAAKKSLQVLASGPEDAFATVQPILQSFAERIVYAGDLGTGTVIKLAHNLVRRGIGLAIGEGLVLGVKSGAPPQLLWECMHWGLDVQLHQLLTTFSETLLTGGDQGPASFGIGLARKDVGLATELARRHNVPMPIAALVEQVMIHAINRGWSEQSTASLFRLQQEAAGIAVSNGSK